MPPPEVLASSTIIEETEQQLNCSRPTHGWPMFGRRLRSWMGTLVKALPRISEAMWLSTRTGTRHHAWCLHTQFELDKPVPVRMDLTDGATAAIPTRRPCAAWYLQRTIAT